MKTLLTILLSIPLAILSLSSLTSAANENLPEQPQARDRKANLNTTRAGEQAELNQPNPADQDREQSPTPPGDSRKSEISIANRGTTAREHLSIVAQKVEELLALPDRRGGIGEQVRVFAQEQQQIQERVKTSLDQLEKRPKIIRALLGPNYNAINRLQATITQNEKIIGELLILQENALYPAEKESIAAAITTLEQQNSLLSQRIQLASDTGGFLGWIFRFFAQTTPTYSEI